jgi:two-component system CheB/CheR fusion protein
MAREGLAAPLNEAFSRTQRLGETVELINLTVGTNGATKVVDVHVQPLTEPSALRGMVLVVFTDVSTSPAAAKAPGKALWAKAHAQQLGSLEHELKVTREEMQTSQEQLKSANEELQSTNEELQSTNEELTTSREEMQSMNEELQVVNHELNAKIDELSRASDDMKNLLSSTHIATLFLTNDLKVRRYTTQATNIFKLIPSDAGRSITDLVSTLDYPDLVDDANEVLNSLVFHEVQVSAKDGRSFMVRTMPYRTQDNRIDGVVITFTDTTMLTKAL